MPALPAHCAIAFHPVRREAAQNRLAILDAGTGAIHILDAHQPSPAMGTRIQIAAERGNQRTEMQKTAGRRRKAAHIRSIFHDKAPKNLIQESNAAKQKSRNRKNPIDDEIFSHPKRLITIKNTNHKRLA